MSSEDELRCTQCVKEGLKQMEEPFFYCINSEHVHSDDDESLIGVELNTSLSSDDSDDSEEPYITSGICIAGTCDTPIRFRCTGCQEVGYCSEKCQGADWAEHKHECGASDPFNWKKHGLFTTVEHAIDDMVEDSYEDDSLQVMGELIEQELLDLPSEEGPDADLHARAVNFISLVEAGPNMYQLLYEHPFGDGDEELLQLVEDHIEGLIDEHVDLKDDCYIGANVEHRAQLSNEIQTGEALHDEIAYYIGQGIDCPDRLREEGIKLIGKRRRARRKKKRKKRKRKRTKKKKPKRKRKHKKKGRKKKRKGKKRSTKKKRASLKKKDKKKKKKRRSGKSKKPDNKKTRSKKRKKADKKDRKKDKKSRKKRKKADKKDRKKDRKSRKKNKRGDNDGSGGEGAGSSSSSDNKRRQKDDDGQVDNDSPTSSGGTSLRENKEASKRRQKERREKNAARRQEKRERAQDRAETRRDNKEARDQAADARKDRLKEAKAATDEAQEELKQAEIERRRQATQGEVGVESNIYLY